MRIALVNPITQTVDRPQSFWSLFGRRPKFPLSTDAEVNFVKLAQAMADLGHEVTLFISDCFKPIKPYTPKGTLKIKYLPTRGKLVFPPAYMPLLPSLHHELKEGHFEVIQASDLFFPNTLIAATVAKQLFVWEEIDQYFSRTQTRLLQKCHHQTVERWLRKKTIVIPRSQSAKEFLEIRGWKSVAEVIPTPVDTNLFKPFPNCAEEYLLVVSRLAPDRGLSFLLEVLERVRSVQPKIKLVVVGQGSFADTFQGEIIQRGLSDHVQILSNFVSHQEIQEIYNRSYMTLITTVGGLYPYTASESMACGKVVISRFKRGLKDIIQSGQTGFLVDGAEEMAQRILDLLQDSQKRYEMGKGARRFVEDYCDLKKVAAQFIDTYKHYSDTSRK